MTSVQREKGSAILKRLEGKVALVTGGSRGIGAAIALRLAEEGATVAISYAKSASRADEVVKKMQGAGSTAESFCADVSSGEQAQKLIKQVVEKFGKIDILINNAGVAERVELESISLEHYVSIFDVNVKGVIATTIAAVGKMSSGGRIINISSVAAKLSAPGFSVYSASKAAVDTLTRIWAQELGHRNITVNAVAPGATSTEMFAELPEEAKQDLLSKTALKRLGQPNDIAAVVAFLASGDGSWVTGQTIVADGGLRSS